MKELNINVGAIESITIYKEKDTGLICYPKILPKKWMGIVWNNPQPEKWWYPREKKSYGYLFGISFEEWEDCNDLYFKDGKFWDKSKYVIRMISGKEYVRYFEEYSEAKWKVDQWLLRAESANHNFYVLKK